MAGGHMLGGVSTGSVYLTEKQLTPPPPPPPAGAAPGEFRVQNSRLSDPVGWAPMPPFKGEWIGLDYGEAQVKWIEGVTTKGTRSAVCFTTCL